MDAHHEPVLCAEALGLLAPAGEGLYVDSTVGLGGHAAALLARAPGARLLGIDRDPEALAVARARLRPFGDRVRLVEGDFHRLAELWARLGGAPGDRGRWPEPAERPRGILADLGVSSLQLDRPERGFSFRRDGPLDMRMGGSEMTAADVVNRYSEADLERIFREYGEERQARRIARAVVEARREARIRTTAELAAILRRAKGLEARPGGRPGEGRAAAGRREGRVDPATRVFQALRIEVNRELADLGAFIDQAAALLEHDGRLVIISYHSLEDRIVKNSLRDLARGEIDATTGRPLAETRLIEVLTRKPVRPSPREVAFNPRSRSARLRAARRI